MGTHAAIVIRNDYNNLWAVLSINHDGMDLFNNLLSGEWTYRDLLLVASHAGISSFGKNMDEVGFYRDEDNCLQYFPKEEAIERAVQGCSYVAEIDRAGENGYTVIVVKDGDYDYLPGHLFGIQGQP